MAITYWIKFSLLVQGTSDRVSVHQSGYIYQKSDIWFVCSSTISFWSQHWVSFWRIVLVGVHGSVWFCMYTCIHIYTSYIQSIFIAATGLVIPQISTDYIWWCETSQVQFPIGVAESSHFFGSPYDPRPGALLLQNAVDATSSLKCSRLGRIEDGNRNSDGWRSYPPQYFISIYIYILYIYYIINKGTPIWKDPVPNHGV